MIGFRASLHQQFTFWHWSWRLGADSDEAARLKRDDCAQGFLDDAAPFNEMIAPGGPRVLAE